MDAIERLLIERECEQLSAAYARMIDFRDFEAVTRVFTESAELVGERTWSGRDAILRALGRAPAGRRVRHVLTNPYIDVRTPDLAHGIVYFTSWAGEAAAGELPPPVPAAVGHYEDEYARTPDGWRIARRVTRFAFLDPASAAPPRN